MHFKNIHLKNFRNFNELKLDLNPQVNLFVGDNGQGKTNLLEALHVLTKGSSFRPSQAQSLINYDSEPMAMITSQIDSRELVDKVQLQILKNRKKFLLNEKTTSPAQLAKKFSVVLFSPESLAAVKEGPQTRRDLIDGFIANSMDQVGSRILVDFKKSLRSRNRILRDFKAEIRNRVKTQELLHSIEQPFLRAAVALTALRIKSLAELEPFMQKAMDFISDSQNVDISVDYLVSSKKFRVDDLDFLTDAIPKRVKELNSAELAAGVSLVGPHKHDIVFRFGGQDSRYFCSQGQQRALILSYKMAQIMYHYQVYQIHPVLLLDDVLSELDAGKRSNLIEFLKGIESQIILTTTEYAEAQDFKEKNLSLYQISQGRAILV